MECNLGLEEKARERRAKLMSLSRKVKTDEVIEIAGEINDVLMEKLPRLV